MKKERPVAKIRRSFNGPCRDRETKRSDTGKGLSTHYEPGDSLVPRCHLGELTVLACNDRLLSRGQIIPSFLARRTASPRRVAPSFRKMLLK
jgi:hypothetical protein